jgi:hypothetical protein
MTMTERLTGQPGFDDLRHRIQLQVTLRIANGADVRDAASSAARDARDEALAKGWSLAAANAMGVLVTEIGTEVAAELVRVGRELTGM